MPSTVSFFQFKRGPRCRTPGRQVEEIKASFHNIKLFQSKKQAGNKNWGSRLTQIQEQRRNTKTKLRTNQYGASNDTHRWQKTGSKKHRTQSKTRHMRTVNFQNKTVNRLQANPRIVAHIQCSHTLHREARQNDGATFLPWTGCVKGARETPLHSRVEGRIWWRNTTGRVWGQRICPCMWIASVTRGGPSQLNDLPWTHTDWGLRSCSGGDVQLR